MRACVACSPRERIAQGRSLSLCRGSRRERGGELLLGRDTTGVRPGPRGLGHVKAMQVAAAHVVAVHPVPDEKNSFAHSPIS